MAQRIAYVTGGMGGIGTSICRELHDAGHKVIAGCGPTRDAQKWLDEQKQAGYTFYASVGNVGSWESTVEAFSKVKAEHGNPDILVNNAGITRDGMFVKMTPQAWSDVIDTNLNSLFNVTKQVVEGMVTNGWCVLSISHRLTDRRVSLVRRTTRLRRRVSMASQWRSHRSLPQKALQ